MTSKDSQNELEGFNFRMPRRRQLQVGEIVEGKVVLIGDTCAFVDIGAKSEATLDLKEITNEKGERQVQVGDQVEAYLVAIDPELVLSRAMARSQLNRERLQDAHDLGIPVEGKVTGVNKGGLEIEVGGLQGFCPLGQIELSYCADPSVYVGRSLEFRVTELGDGARPRLVLSRRALLEEARQEEASATRAQLIEGAELEGKVVTLQPYGAFVELGGGIQGLVHISEIGHARIEHPSEVLQVGQTLRVKVLRIEADPQHPKREKISLSVKALLDDPWASATASFSEGTAVTGKIVRLQPYGAFIELAPGVDGLAHVSELSERPVRHPSDVVAVGQTVNAIVLKIDHQSRRISLSLLAQRPAGGEELTVGTTVEAVVNRVKPFGLLVQIKGAGKQARGLIPVEETGTGKGANLRAAFPEGSTVKAMIIAIEPDTGRMRLSISAQADQQERESFSSFMEGGSTERPTSSSFGTLGDLLKQPREKSKERRKR